MFAKKTSHTRLSVSFSRLLVRSLTQSKQFRRKAQPKFLTCPETQQTIQISTATLQDIREAARKKTDNSRLLVTIESPSTRQVVYHTASQALERLEQRILPNYGGRPWTVSVKFSDTTSPYFRYMGGHVELATWAQVLERIPDPPRFQGYSQGAAAASVASHHDDDNDNEETASSTEEEKESPEELKLEEMLGRTSCPLSRLAYKERWRVLMPTVTIKWTSPLHQVFHSRKSAWDNAVQLCRNEVLLDRMLAGYGANGNRIKVTWPSRKAALKAGQIRFDRDGLWVVGQEESWQRERLQEMGRLPVVSSTTMPRGASDGKQQSALTYYIQCNRVQHRMKRLKEIEVVRKNTAVEEVDIFGNSQSSNDGADSAASLTVKELGQSALEKREAVSFTLRDADRELRVLWKQLKDSERSEWTERFNKNDVAGDASDADRATAVSPTPSSAVGRVTPDSENDSSYTSKPNTIDGDSLRPGSLFRGADEVTDEMNGTVASPCTTPAQRSEDAPESKMIGLMARAQESSHWRLSPDQIKLCYDAGMAHFDQIMLTVKARDLIRELQDGFDLFRERGRGRFDMELPAFDQPQFKFLTDVKKSPWMPIVKEILGKDAVLIHKGIFLSLPGAERQDYHQDGVHLTTQYQKPCHAVNVFVPLVDLSMERGPTEFCLGSHILGQETYDETFLETPLVTAGTPIVFDYRLGHRGLANTTSECRPIVYCTYARAADGNEFRDLVNFSRKRYHRIGDLVSQASTREQRARKRETVSSDPSSGSERSSDPEAVYPDDSCGQSAMRLEGVGKKLKS